MKRAELERRHSVLRSADCNSIQLIHGEGTGTNVECHHVFPAPYARILSLAYLDEQGVIIAFSTTSANEGPAQKRAINIWQFTQHRHAVALHDMLYTTESSFIFYLTVSFINFTVPATFMHDLPLALGRSKQRARMSCAVRNHGRHNI